MSAIKIFAIAFVAVAVAVGGGYGTPVGTCGSSQALYNGQCVACNFGQVQNPNDPSSCISCPSGQVKNPDANDAANAVCASATDFCGTAQFAYNGRCTNCNFGQIRSSDGSTCISCPSGQVKNPDANDVANAVCASAKDICGNAQFAYNGRCTNCNFGQIRSSDGSTCSTCPAGSVKVPDRNDVATAVCTSATTACGNAQFAYNGRCTNCNFGQVRSSDGSTCTTCGSGLVKLPDANNVATAVCASAVTSCGNAQFAYNGRCTNCNFGQVRSCDGSTCLSCPSGTVKVPDANDVATAVCAAALTACGNAQFAYNGRCTSCNFGQIQNATGSSCINCFNGFVKVPDSNSAVSAVCTSATTACGTAQFAYNGRCTNCNFGQIRSSDGSTCTNCPAGSVKVPDRNDVAAAVCSAAKDNCGKAQFAYNGRCTNCNFGQIRSSDGSTCTNCPAGSVKVPDRNDAANAVCSPAKDNCGNAQFSYNGRCTNCNFGQIQSADGSTCVSCPEGSVKVPDRNDADNAVCTSATTACSNTQFAYNGRCTNCPSGTLQSGNGATCA